MDAVPDPAHTPVPSSSSAVSPPDSSASPDPERVQQYVRRAVIQAVVMLFVLVGSMALVGRFFADELLLATSWVNEQVGFVGLAAILLLTDSVITPVPPDLLLVVIANTDLSHHWWIYVPTLGVISSGAGILAWHLSARVGHTRLPRLIFGRFRERNAALVSRYGVLAVALGALTPIPYSITCWTAGILHVPVRRVAWVTLLRIPRFIGYYLVIAWSTHLLDPPTASWDGGPADATVRSTSPSAAPPYPAAASRSRTYSSER